MKEKTNKLKKFTQFINEDHLYDETKRAEKQIKINKLERELFYDIIKNLINSNNVDKMNEYINYMTGKLWLSLNQFIHQQIYKLKNNDKDKDIEVSEINIDYDDLDKKIDLFKEQYKKII